MHKPTVLLLMGLFALSACVATKPSTFQPTEESPYKIQRNLDRKFRSVSTFHGEATITIDTPDQSGQVRGKIEVKFPQKAEIILQTPFGGMVGRLEIRRHYLMFYNADNQLQFIGSPKHTGIPALPQLFTGQQEIIPILTGMINLPDNLHSTLTGDSLENGKYSLYFSNDSTTSRYQFNPQTDMFDAYREFNRNTGQQTDIAFGKFTEVNGMQLPRSIKVTQPNEHRLFSIYYHSMTINREEHANAL